MAYQRRKTSTVKIGELHIGSNHPIVPQSMTTTDTMDTQKSVEQIIRMVNTGCELVRLTAPSMNEAQNLAEIKKALLEKIQPELITLNSSQLRHIDTKTLQEKMEERNKKLVSY